MFDSTGLEILDRRECLRLLASVPLGRVVLTVQALPAVHAVPFIVAAEEILFRTPATGALAIAAHGAVVAFEADHLDPEHGSGWSVLVLGRAHQRPDPADLHGANGSALRSWTPHLPTCVIAIPMERISGRRATTAVAVLEWDEPVRGHRSSTRDR